MKLGSAIFETKIEMLDLLMLRVFIGFSRGGSRGNAVVQLQPSHSPLIPGSSGGGSGSNSISIQATVRESTPLHGSL